MSKTYSIAMGAVMIGESASPKNSAVMRGIIGSRCYAQFAGGQLEEVVDGGFILGYLPDIASVDFAVSALREAGVNTMLVVSEEIDNGETIEMLDVKTIPEVCKTAKSDEAEIMVNRFIDEEGKVYTLNQLKADFDELKADGEVEDDATFSDYIKDCTDKDGALTEITRADAERELKEAHTIYLEIWDDYQTGYAHYEDLRMAFESYSEAVKLLESFDQVK